MLDPSRLAEIGVYVGPDGGYYRKHSRIVNIEYDPSDPLAMAKGLMVAYDEELVPHPVILPLATDPASIEEARRKAVAARADFYHPVHGWLRGGTKREVDLPENTAGAARLHERRRVVVAPVAAAPPVSDDGFRDVGAADIPAAERSGDGASPETRNPKPITPSDP
jgi:hypothetical protein